MTTTDARATTPLLAPAYRWATVGMVSLIFLFAFEAMAVTTIMPTVSADLEGRSWYSATFSATLAASIVGMVAAGIWSDRRGPRAPMFASAVVFGIGLLAAGLAPGIEVFVGARFLQGLGGGAITVTLYVLVARIYAPVDHPRIFGAFAASWVIPSMIGPTIAGLIAEAVGWRWVFLGVVGIAAAATAMLVPALRGVADRPEPSPVASVRRLLLATVLAMGVVAVDLAGRVDGAAAYVATAGAFVLVVVTARPLLPPGTLRAAPGLPAVVGLRGVIAAAFFATEIYVPYLLQEQYDLALWLSGAALTVGALGWAGASQVQARLGARLTNATALRTGALLLVVGTAVVLATAAARADPVAHRHRVGRRRERDGPDVPAHRHHRPRSLGRGRAGRQHRGHVDRGRRRRRHGDLAERPAVHQHRHRGRAGAVRCGLRHDRRTRDRGGPRLAAHHCAWMSA